MAVLTYIESLQGQVKKASLEALSEAKRLATVRGGDVAAVVVGCGLDAVVEQVKKIGPAKIFTVDNDAVKDYQSEGHTAAVKKAAEEFGAEAILIAATTVGRDLAPRVAASMNVMFLPDVIGLNAEGSDIIAKRPVYAGKVLLNIKAHMFPVVMTTRPNVFAVEEADGAGEVVAIDAPFDAKTTIVETRMASADRPDVAEADVIVAGGRGLKDEEHFKLVEELADALGAAVGASRPVVDSGWRPHSEQVGQTGKTVGPTLYFAAGISGAIQHIAGMRTSKTIVAINKDADAPIFKIADYGIVGDALEVLPAITQALKK